MFNKHQCLIWLQRNTTGLPAIKRCDPRNRASHLRNTEISAKCVTYLCQSGNYVHTHALSTVDKRVCFTFINLADAFIQSDL